MLAGALEAAEREAAPVSEAVARAADRAGRRIAVGGADLAEVLTRAACAQARLDPAAGRCCVTITLS